MCFWLWQEEDRGRQVPNVMLMLVTQNAVRAATGKESFKLGISRFSILGFGTQLQVCSYVSRVIISMLFLKNLVQYL